MIKLTADQILICQLLKHVATLELMFENHMKKPGTRLVPTTTEVNNRLDELSDEASKMDKEMP